MYMLVGIKTTARTSPWVNHQSQIMQNKIKITLPVSLCLPQEQVLSTVPLPSSWLTQFFYSASPFFSISIIWRNASQRKTLSVHTPFKCVDFLLIFGWHTKWSRGTGDWASITSSKFNIYSLSNHIWIGWSTHCEKVYISGTKYSLVNIMSAKCIREAWVNERVSVIWTWVIHVHAIRVSFIHISQKRLECVTKIWFPVLH